MKAMLKFRGETSQPDWRRASNGAQSGAGRLIGDTDQDISEVDAFSPV
jgi:hypothetical protein